MRILFWSELFRPHIGGVEVWSVQLIHALQRLGYDCLAVASHGPTRMPDETEFEGIPVCRFSFHEALLRRELPAIRRLMAKVAELKERFRPDIIHLNTSQPSLFFHAKTTTHGPCHTVITIHEPLLESAGTNSLLGRVLGTADKVVAVSSAMLEDLQHQTPAVSEKCRVIHNAVPPTATKPMPLAFTPPRLFCAGRLVPEKGFDLALEAFARLHQVHKRAELTIAGNGPARADLERRAAELGVRSAVRFPGWVEPSNVTNYINAATVVIIPSRWREPFGLVALQAAQMARPVIAHRVGGLPDIIIDNETGMLVSPGDIHGLVGALSFLLEHPGRAIEMGKAARRRNDDVFNFQQFVSQYDELYRSLALDYVPLSVGEPLT